MVTTPIQLLFSLRECGNDDVLSYFIVHVRKQELKKSQRKEPNKSRDIRTISLNLFHLDLYWCTHETLDILPQHPHSILQ